MDRHQDSLNDSDYYHIFPTLIGRYDLRNFHPAEEIKAMALETKSLYDLKTDKDFLTAQRMMVLRNVIDGCLKAYSAEYGADVYQIDTTWHERHDSNSIDTVHDAKDTFIGYYFPKAQIDTVELVVDSPYKNPLHVPVEKSVSVYTAPNEKFKVESGTLLVTPAHLNKRIIVKEGHCTDVIVFNVKKTV